MKKVNAGLRVLLVEATAYGAARIDETLAPGGRALLTGLGCWERFCAEGFLESHGTAATWGSDAIHQNEFLLSARGSCWHRDRRRFDAILADCTSGAVLECNDWPGSLRPNATSASGVCGYKRMRGLPASMRGSSSAQPVALPAL
jgi:hypothetical protein